jgi:hypothetical protein
MKRSPAGSISHDNGGHFTRAAMGSQVIMRCQPFNGSVPYRSLAAVIKRDGQIVS